MDDPPPVTVPTAVREPFDFGDEPFGDHDAIASVLDDAGRVLGVERNAGRALKAAPAVFGEAARSEYAAPSAAAAAAAQKAVADELEALADGLPAEESLGVQIGTTGGSRATFAATAASATDAKAARRADQLKQYGRGGALGPGAAKKNARLPESLYARELEARSRAKAEREAREARARAPFVTAKYGVKLPAPVDTLQIGEKSAEARARRAALGAAKSAKQTRERARPLSAGPLPGVWRVNANVAHDVTDPISVSFNEAKRARAAAARRAQAERAKRDANGARAPRVDRSKYPGFKVWLDARAEREAKRREAACAEKARDASGAPSAPGEPRPIPRGGAGSVETAAVRGPEAAPASNRFVALTEALADRTAARSGVSSEDREKAPTECAAEAVHEAVEAADRRDEAEAAAAAALAAEAAHEDEASVRRVAETRAPTKEEQLANALAEMTPEARLAARARASKGWSGDFTGVFFDAKAAEGEDAPAATPTWSEKPNLRLRRPLGDARSNEDDARVAATDTDALAVQFIGPNAAALAFRALNPDAPKEATASATGGTRAAYASPGAIAAREAAARAAEGLDPSDPASVARCAARLAEMGIAFFGKNKDELAFKAVFPEFEVPTETKKNEKGKAKGASLERASNAFDPAVPLAHQTGAEGLAVEFIGANAAELTRSVLGGEEAREEASSADGLFSEADVADDASPPTETLDGNPGAGPAAVLDAVDDADGSPLSAAQEAAWTKAAVATPGTYAAPATLEANLADAQTIASGVSAAEAAAAATRLAAEAAEGDAEVASRTEAERASVIDAGTGVVVSTALVAPLAEDALRDAGAPGGGEL